MLSISRAIKGGARANYYLNLAQQKYYFNGFEPPGYWLGEAARLLALSGTVKRKVLSNLLKGFSPDGQQPLVQNAGNPKRQRGWDLTFSAPKSVSVLFALGSEGMREAIELAHQQAVRKALTYLEQRTAVTRRGQGGASHEPAAVLFAVFQHSTSRAQDPQLHSHAVLINLGLRQDGSTGTIRSIEVFRQKMTAGAIYQTELAHGLQQRLGLKIIPQRVGFHVQGVPHKLCATFSTRRREVVALLKQRKQSGAVAAKIAALDTRRAKVLLPRAELFALWQKIGKSQGWGAKEAQKLVRKSGRQSMSPKRFEASLLDRIGRLPAEQRTRSQVLRLATELATKSGMDAQSVLQAMENLANQNGPAGLRIDWQRLFDRTPWIPPERRLLRTERRELFPNAPLRRIRGLKLPALVAELPRLAIGPVRKFHPRWWSIRWKRNLVLGELRVQRRLLLPKAPKWNPLKNRSIPALRITSKKSKLLPLRQRKGYFQSH